MNDERQDFSERLATAMAARGYPPRPGQLHKLFNSHYRGRSVTFSTASKWLRGKAIPEQEKLQVLACILTIEPHVLRYGPNAVKAGPDSEQENSLTGASSSDQQAIAAYQALPSEYREIFGNLFKLVINTVQR